MLEIKLYVADIDYEGIVDMALPKVADKLSKKGTFLGKMVQKREKTFGKIAHKEEKKYEKISRKDDRCYRYRCSPCNISYIPSSSNYCCNR